MSNAGSSRSTSVRSPTRCTRSASPRARTSSSVRRGVGPGPDPDRVRVAVGERAHGRDEVLGCLLELDPPTVPTTGTSGSRPSSARAPRAGVRGAYDGADRDRGRDPVQRVRSGQPPPERLGRHTGADGEHLVGDPRQAALDADVRRVPERVLELVEREAVVRVRDERHAGPMGGQPAQRARLGAVRVDHVEAARPEQRREPASAVASLRGAIGAHEGRLDDGVQAGRLGLVEECAARARDDGDVVARGVQLQGAAQRDTPGARDEAGDDLGHLDPRAVAHDPDLATGSAPSRARSRALSGSPGDAAEPDLDAGQVLDQASGDQLDRWHRGAAVGGEGERSRQWPEAAQLPGRERARHDLAAGGRGRRRSHRRVRGVASPEHHDELRPQRRHPFQPGPLATAVRRHRPVTG